MEDPLHSLTARSLLENSFIDFRISTRVEAHSFQTNLFLKSSLLHFQKGCLICLHILSSWSYPRSNNPKDYCLVILEATGLFRCSVAVWFLSENLKQDYWYGSLQHLKWRLRKARAFLSFHGAKCFKSLYKLLHRSFVPLLLEIIFSYFLFCVTFSVIMFDNCLIWFRKNHY